MSLPSFFDYLPRRHAEILCKMAEGEQGSFKNDAGQILSGVVGFGAGTAAGLGASALADKAYQHFTGQRIPQALALGAVPAVGGALGLAYNLARAHQLREMQRAAEGTEHAAVGRNP